MSDNFSFKPRMLGKSGITVFPVGLGGGYATPGKIFDMAYERGINFFFWGPIFPTYIPMTRWLSSRTVRQREKLIIGTVSYIWKLPGSLTRTINRHLRWLKTDYIDIFFLGWIRDADERALDTLLRMKEKGLIRKLAFSAHDRRLCAQLIKKWPIDVIMIRYNIMHTGAEKEIFPYLPDKNRPGVIAFNAQKHGGIIGKVKDKQITPADLYRFVLTSPYVDLCLAGPRTVSQIEWLFKAVELGPLEQKEYRKLRELGISLRKKK